MYSLHDIEVNGLDLAEVLECEIESRAGEHSTLVILARVTEEEFVFEISDCQDLEVLPVSYTHLTLPTTSRV